MFKEVDALVTPVSPFPAFKLGEKLQDPMEMYLSDIYTITGDLAGIPCMSVPCGATAAGLPVGMQILRRATSMMLACSSLPTPSSATAEHSNHGEGRGSWNPHPVRLRA